MHQFHSIAQRTATQDETVLLKPPGAPWSLTVAPEPGTTASVYATLALAKEPRESWVWVPIAEDVSDAQLIVSPAPVTFIEVRVTGPGEVKINGRG